MVNVLQKNTSLLPETHRDLILFYCWWLDTMRRDNYLVIIIHIIPIMPERYVFASNCANCEDVL